MSLTQNAAGAPLFVEYKPGTRRRIAAAVDALVALLDEIDGDADFEEDDPLEDDAPLEDVGDDEPSLGAPAPPFCRISGVGRRASRMIAKTTASCLRMAATPSRRSARRWRRINALVGRSAVRIMNMIPAKSPAAPTWTACRSSAGSAWNMRNNRARQRRHAQGIKTSNRRIGYDRRDE